MFGNNTSITAHPERNSVFGSPIFMSCGGLIAHCNDLAVIFGATRSRNVKLASVATLLRGVNKLPVNDVDSKWRHLASSNAEVAFRFGDLLFSRLTVRHKHRP